MHVDWTVPIWNLITAAVFLIVVVYRMSQIELKVQTMWDHFINLPEFNRRKTNRD